jgi:phenylalanyl-tRNA synthetase beta chain
MLVSWNWLKEYVGLDMPVDELTRRLTMAGLNLEDAHRPLDGEIAIDLEVTSNRPDCLGHIGVAREVSVLFSRDLKIPEARPKAVAARTADATSVAIEDESLCPLYVARVIRGVKIVPSPDWLARRLAAASFKRDPDTGAYQTYRPINNVVDITNYVLLECGQPLHAFDFAKLRGGKIVVRRARAGEAIEAIDHETYKLDPEMLVIADAERPVAIAGVMGGADTEIGAGTADVLIETADFAPMSVRATARKLKLHSDSSYRFERGVDRARIDWASRRCCELILELAGGELLDVPVIAGQPPTGERPPIVLRFDQLPRVLGIDVPPQTATKILEDLGLEVKARDESRVTVVPPSWRRDLTREADLIEEVARIHGYDRIPDDAPVPLGSSARTTRDRVADRVREVLTATGFYEAITLSLVTEESRPLFMPRGDVPPLSIEHGDFKRLGTLRQSLVPSLLECRRENEKQGTAGAELFELAKVYLAARPGGDEERVEPRMVGVVSGRPFRELRGVLEALVERVGRGATLGVRPSDVPQFIAGRGAELLLNGEPWGWLGELDRRVTDRIDLQDAVTVAEFALAPLERVLELTPRADELPKFPGMERDLNFVLKEPVPWSDLERVVRESAGPLLERIDFAGQYRGKQLGADQKSYIIRIRWRSPNRTLTSEEVEGLQQQVVTTAAKELGASLR